MTNRLLTLANAADQIYQLDRVVVYMELWKRPLNWEVIATKLKQEASLRVNLGFWANVYNMTKENLQSNNLNQQDAEVIWFLYISDTSEEKQKYKPLAFRVLGYVPIPDRWSTSENPIN